MSLISTVYAMQVSAEQQSEMLAMSNANGAAMADLLSALDTALQNGENTLVMAYDMQEQGGRRHCLSKAHSVKVRPCIHKKARWYDNLHAKIS